VLRGDEALMDVRHISTWLPTAGHHLASAHTLCRLFTIGAARDVASAPVEVGVDAAAEQR
jgi:hypothetical protein